MTDIKETPERLENVSFPRLRFRLRPLRGRLQRWCSGLTEDSESGHALFRVAAVGLVRRTRGFLRLLRGKSEFSQY